MTTWQIGESGTAIALDGTGKGEVTFTVTNAGIAHDRAVLTVSALDGAAESWFTVPEPQRAVAPGASVLYPVGVNVPLTTAAGTYGMQGVTYSADTDPAESSATSKRVDLTVGAPTPPSGGVPRWIFVVIAAAVLLVIGVVAFLLLRGGDGDDRGGPVDPGPLTSSAAPRISGEAGLGGTLTASPGTWSVELDETSYTWLRCTGGYCHAVPGADDPTYEVTVADVDHSVRVEVTATAGDAEVTAGSRSTPVVLPLTATAPPRIGGNLALGQVVTTTRGAWSRPGVDASIQWQRCDPYLTNCNPIAGKTGTTYLLTEADVGTAVRAEVTATLAGATGLAHSEVIGTSNHPVVTIPDVVGMSPTTAEFALRINLLRPVTVSVPSTSPDDCDGTVTAQDPAAHLTTVTDVEIRITVPYVVNAEAGATEIDIC